MPHSFITRSSVERLFMMLGHCSEPRSKWSILCALRTNTPSLDRIIKIAIDNGLIFCFGTGKPKYQLTSKGHKLLNAWNSD